MVYFWEDEKKNQQQVLSDLASTTKGVNYIAELCLSTHTTDSKLRVCSFWTQASKTHLACIHFGDFAILTAVYIVPAVGASSYVPKILWCQQIKLNPGCFWFRIPFLPQCSKGLGLLDKVLDLKVVFPYSIILETWEQPLVCPYHVEKTCFLLKFSNQNTFFLQIIGCSHVYT